ncbi:hypothetical protein BDQ17DRAFT_1405239 [Cyathus striatus]|nr:hypothetical protein BDQ17DRAFT_1405239 [Cyathus striatus]
MTTETVLSISHYKFPPSSSGSLVEVDPDLNATITVQSTPVPTSTNLPSNSNAFVESDSEHPTTAQQPPEQFQMLTHPNSATPDPALTSARGTSEHLQASPQSPHEIRIVSPSEPSSTPAHPKRINGPHPLSAADLRMIYGDRIIEEEIDQGLRPKPLRTFSSEPPTPNVFDSNTSGVPSRSISPLTEALLSVAQRMSSQKTTETRKDSDFFQERFSPDYDELAHSFATLGLMSGRDDGRTGRYQVTVEEEEDIDAYRAAPKYSLPPPMTLARPPPPTISRASSFTDIRNAGSRSTNAWTTTPEDELFTDGYRTTLKQPLPLTSIPSTHSQPSKVSGTRSSTDTRNTGRPFLAATPLRSNKPEKNGYLRAEPGWKRVPAPPSQVSQLSPLPLSLSPADRAANKSRDLWFPDPSYVPSPPINPGTLGPFAARQDYTKEDHSDKMPKMDSRDGAQGNKLSRQPSTNSLKAESITYNAGCSNKGKGKERVAPMPTYLSVDKFHNVNTGLWDEGEDHSQPISQQPTPYELYEILQRQTKERTSSSNVRNSSENFSPIPTRPRLSEPVVDSTKKPAESSYLHFVDPLPNIQDSPTFWPGQPDRNRNAKGNPHGSVRFANPPVEQFPGASTSNGMQSSSRGFVQPLNATRTPSLQQLGLSNNMPTSTSWGPSCENPLVSSPSSTFPSWNQQQLLAPLWRAPQGPGSPWENTYAGLPGNYRVLGPTGPNLQPGMTYEWPGNGWYLGPSPETLGIWVVTCHRLPP